MNENFGNWCRAANLDPTDSYLRTRWQGIESFLKTPYKVEDVISTICLFFNLQVSPEFLKRFVAFFVEQDAAFDSQNSLEISLLAGAVLREIITKEEERINNLVLLGLLCAEFIYKTPIQDIYKEIITCALKAQVDTRESLCKFERYEVQLPNVKSLLDIMNSEQVEFNPTFAKQLGNYISETNRAFAELLSEKKRNEKYIKICREDLQILWWLNNKWNNHFKKPYSEINIAEAALYSGKELADIIKVLPGPYSADSVLNRILIECPKNVDLSLLELMKLIDTNWKREIISTRYPSTGGYQFTPILQAIKNSYDLDGDDAWSTLFKKCLNLTPESIKRNSLEFSRQTYFECLFSKALEEAVK